MGPTGFGEETDHSDRTLGHAEMVTKGSPAPVN